VGLSIRLKRLGSNQKPYFRAVVSDSQRPPKGQALEGVGSYDPLAKTKPVKLDVARIEALRKNGATLSPSVARLLKRAAALPKA
jgi:small subunit ribosomal protein S16